MGFWDKVSFVEVVEQPIAKNEVLKEIEQQRRILKGDNPKRKGNPIYNWFNDGVSCKPKITNMSFLYKTTPKSVGLTIYNSQSEMLDLIEESVKTGELDKELQELQERMNNRIEKLRESRSKKK